MSARPIDAHRAPPRRPSRFGFTLIEVMVVLALTLVMMSLFATIFSMTGTFVTRQKAVGENDQAARMLTTVLKTDLQARTMRFLAPFHPNANGFSDGNARQGYFYVSENNPYDDTDDVLQFTVALQNNAAFTQSPNPAAGTQFYGAATFLPAPWQSGVTYPPGTLVRPTKPSTATGFVYKNEGPGNLVSGGSEPPWSTTLGGPTPDGAGTQWTTLLSPIDQPDGDDGLILYDANGNRTLNPANGSPNNTGASPYAEVCYFLRHGNLYRRVSLIRNPYDSGNAQILQPVDSDATPAPLIPALYPPYPMTPTAAGSGNFLTDFDYSARLMPFDPTGGVTGVSFLGAGSNISNTDNSLNNVPAGSIPIGRPDNRFGFDQRYVTTGGAQQTNGTPREYGFSYNGATNTVTPSGFPADSQGFDTYFGRYTDEETSNSSFQFPGNLAMIGGTPSFSPVGFATDLGLDTNSYTMWLLNANPAITFQSFAGGLRRGEDILLTNVISFDVKLWDPHYSETTPPNANAPTASAAGIDFNHNGVLDPGPGGFADIGHGAAAGDFGWPNNIFCVYGPRVPTAYTVPTTAGTPYWEQGTGANWYTPPPPFSPQQPTFYAYTVTINNPTTGNPVTVPVNYNNVFDTWFTQFNFDNLTRTYDTPPSPNNTADTVPLAPAPYRPRLGNPWAPSTAYAVGQTVDPINSANGYTYVCTVAGTSAAAPPAGQPDPFSLSDPINAAILSGTPPGTDGTVQWQAKAGVAVQAIQITVKYLDPSQNVLRQVTIVQSLTQ